MQSGSAGPAVIKKSQSAATSLIQHTYPACTYLRNFLKKYIPYLGLVMVMMNSMSSSTETTPSLSPSARRRILPGTPREDTMRWKVSGRTGESCVHTKAVLKVV